MRISHLLSSSGTLFCTLLLLCISSSSFGQLQRIEKTPKQEYDCFLCGYEHSKYPVRTFTPYLDLLVGFSTFNDYGYSGAGIATEFRGGIRVGKSMLAGSGISLITMDGYEVGVVLPLEVGYRTKDEKFDITSSIGMAYIPYASYSSPDRYRFSGRTISVDAYWRHILTQRRLRFVVAAGVMMYDFGTTQYFNCSSCGPSTGPKYTFRLRAGIGL